NDNFYLAMERVDGASVGSWVKYAEDQVVAIQHSDYLPNIDGAAHFKLVLKDFESGVISKGNQLWIAYASDVPVTEPVKFDRDSEHIEMYVTVITSPDALITSHMGISR